MNHISSPHVTDESIERILQNHSKGPRVTLDDLKKNIVSEHYFTAGNGVSGNLETDCTMAQFDALKLLTFCVLILENGFTVTGESACASPENFDPVIGQRIARENAVQKIWPLMGYALKEQLAEKTQERIAQKDAAYSVTAQRMYEAHATYGPLFRGQKIAWDQIGDEEQSAWIAAAKAI